MERFDVDQIVVSCLSFFSFDGNEKERYFSKINNIDVPAFFEWCGEYCNFCLGVLCIFSEYSNVLLDRYLNASDANALLDVIHRVNVFVCDEALAGLSESEILSDIFWDRLRTDALRAMSELNENPVSESINFDFYSLIDVGGVLQFKKSQNARP